MWALTTKLLDKKKLLFYINKESYVLKMKTHWLAYCSCLTYSKCTTHKVQFDITIEQPMCENSDIFTNKVRIGCWISCR